MWWPFNSRSAPVGAEVSTDEPVMLHGHNLSKWEYLGYTMMSYTRSDKTIIDSTPVFFFCQKTNHKRRSCHIPQIAGFKTHTYWTTTIQPWAAGEKEIYSSVNNPSDFLRAYMLERFSSVWSEETNWWVRTENSKYKGEAARQKKTKPKMDNSPDSTTAKIISVDFTKK